MITSLRERKGGTNGREVVEGVEVESVDRKTNGEANGMRRKTKRKIQMQVTMMKALGKVGLGGIIVVEVQRMDLDEVESTISTIVLVGRVIGREGMIHRLVIVPLIRARKREEVDATLLENEGDVALLSALQSNKTLLTMRVRVCETIEYPNL